MAYLDHIEKLEFDVPKPTVINFEDFAKEVDELKSPSPKLSKKLTNIRPDAESKSSKNSPKIKFKKPHQLPKAEEVDDAKKEINGGWAKLKK